MDDAIKAFRQMFFDGRLYSKEANIYEDSGRQEAAELVIKWLDDAGLKVIRKPVGARKSY